MRHLDSTGEADTTSSPSSIREGATPEEETTFRLLLEQTQRTVQKRVHGIDLDRPEAQTFLGRYRVERLAGRGGMGTVLVARDVWLERTVALKIVNTPGVRERRRLVREGIALAKLSHPNVVQVYDVDIGEHGELAYVAMEHIEGTTLEGWQSDPRRSPREVVEVYLQAARGLQAAHEVGIVHRDFKPSNALIDAAGVVKVADFGLAGTAERGEDEPPSRRRSKTDADASAATTEGAQGLTPGYCAPEQLRGARPTERADQFAFCVALYQALTGTLPFGSTRDVEGYEAAIVAGVGALPGARTLPRSVARVLARGLSLRPEDRFEDMAALIAALAPRPSRWRWATLALVPLAVVLTAALLPPEEVPVEVDPCEDPERTLPLEWSPGQPSASGDATEASPALASSFAREHAAAYRDAWRTAAQGVCRAARRGELQGEHHDQALACLGRVAREYNVVVGLLGAEEPTIDPPSAFDRLSPPDVCVAPQGRPAFGRGDPQLREALDRTLDLQLAGRDAEALVQAEALHARAEAVGDVVVLANVAFLQGKLESLGGDVSGATRHLEEASLHAEKLGDDVLALDAYAELIDVAANLAIDPGMGARWGRLGGAKLQRAGVQRSAVAGQYHAAMANLALRSGDHDAALEHGQRAHALLAATTGEDSLATLVTRTNLAVALAEAGRTAEAIAAYRELLEIRRQHYGPTHLTTLQDELRLARAHMLAGELDEAIARLEHIEQLGTPATTPEGARLLGFAIAQRCDVLVRREDFDRAAEVCEQAFARLPDLAGDERRLVEARAVIHGRRARVLVKQDRLEPALEMLEQEHRLLSLEVPPDAAAFAHNTTVQCAVLASMGRLPQCAERLAQAEPWYQASGRQAEWTKLRKALGLDSTTKTTSGDEPR